jgi:light-regulated signal transduction histidine kinase (bacteriophytochrome)
MSNYFLLWKCLSVFTLCNALLIILNGLFVIRPRDTYESKEIGLSIVKKIIEEKGFKIELDSSPSEGCNFRFTWPKRMI